ncbi:S1C family serine protease [Clostridium sp.]|uniref:S1C family serine protease n=1 Tax=Clostridium sp. TaxID=1506 RepID=UPI003217741E
MSNFEDDYKDSRAKITFNKIKKKRRGKFVVITIVCLFIASLCGTVTAVVMTHTEEGKRYYVQDGEEKGEIIEINTSDLQLQSVVKKVSKSVVSVIKVVDDEVHTTESNIGVGIVVENGEYVITSYYSIKDATRIKLKSYNDVVCNASIIGFDSVYNIAMLKIHGEALTPIDISVNATTIKEGDKVISVGNPLGKSFNENIEVSTIINTRENIVFKNRDTKISESLKMIKADVIPQYINTGAALCSLDGELIGVNNATMSYHSEFLKNSFYISVEDLEPIKDKILDKQDSLIMQIGVYGEEAISQRAGGVQGVYAKEVTKDGTAYEAGIRPTDIIIEVNDIKVSSVGDINSIINDFNTGEVMKCTVFKNGIYVDFNIKIPEKNTKK